MGDKTKIQWCNATWNPIRGCSRVSDGCMNCYAERVAARFSGPGLPYPPNEGGKRLASRRKGLGLTLRDAAIRLGLLPSTLSGLEHGRMAGDWRALTGALGRRAE